MPTKREPPTIRTVTVPGMEMEFVQIAAAPSGLLFGLTKHGRVFAYSVSDPLWHPFEMREAVLERRPFYRCEWILWAYDDHRKRRCANWISEEDAAKADPDAPLFCDECSPRVDTPTEEPAPPASSGEPR